MYTFYDSSNGEDGKREKVGVTGIEQNLEFTGFLLVKVSHNFVYIFYLWKSQIFINLKNRYS